MIVIVLILSLFLNSMVLFLLKQEKSEHKKLKKENMQNLEQAVSLANELHEEGLRKNLQHKEAVKALREVKRLQKELKTYKKSRKL